MKPSRLHFLLILLLVIILASCNPSKPTPTPVASLSPSPTSQAATSTSLPTASPTTTTFTPTPFLSMDASAPCQTPGENELFAYVDCNDILRIRKNLEQDPQMQSYWKIMVGDVKPFLDDLASGSPQISKYNYLNSLIGGHDYLARRLALMYLITGNPDFGQTIVKLLYEVQGYPVSGYDNPSDYNKLLAPVEWITDPIESLLLAYSTVRETKFVTLAQRSELDALFIQQASILIESNGWTDGLWNPGIRNDAAAATIALTISEDARSEYIYHQAVSSLYTRIRAWFDADGGYREYADNYNPLVLDAILTYAEAEAKRGKDIYQMDFGGKNLHKMCSWYLYELSPQGTQPGMNDGSPKGIDPGTFALCARRTGDPEIVFLFKKLSSGQTSFLNGAFSSNSYSNTILWGGQDLIAEAPAWRSAALLTSGLVALRSGWEATDQYLFMQFTPSTHHQHYSFGNIVLFDGNIPWLVDNGYEREGNDYSHDISTADHSTVTVDDLNQTNPGGTLRDLVDLGQTAVVSIQSGTYPGVSQTRTVLWAKQYHRWVIVDDMAGSGNHTYDLRWFIKDNPDPANTSRIIKFSQNNETLLASVAADSPSGTPDCSFSSIDRRYGDGRNLGTSSGISYRCLNVSSPIRFITTVSTSQDNQLDLAYSTEGNSQVDIPTIDGALSWYIPAASGVIQSEAMVVKGLASCLDSNRDGSINAYCLFSGTSFEQGDHPFVKANKSISVEINLNGKTIFSSSSQETQISLYIPQAVQEVQTLVGENVQFTQDGSIITIQVPKGIQSFRFSYK